MSLTPVQADLLLDIYDNLGASEDRLVLLVDSALAHGVDIELIETAIKGVVT